MIFQFPQTAGEIAKALEEETGYMAFTTLPRTLPPKLIRVNRLGGDLINPFTSSDNLIIEVWDTKKHDAEKVALICRNWVFGLRGKLLGGYKVHTVEGDGGVSDDPDPLTATPRFTFTASLVVKGKRL